MASAFRGRGSLPFLLKILACTFVLLTATTPAKADVFENTQTGNGLLGLCRSSDNSREMLACYSYLKGTLDGWLTSENTFRNEPSFCIPKGVTLIQLRDILVRWLDDNPERRHAEGSALIVNAIVRSFPCAE